MVEAVRVAEASVGGVDYSLTVRNIQDRAAKPNVIRAGTRIAFKNSDAFVSFSATVGIDADRGNRGDCEVVVSGDGQELARHRLRGGEAAVAINVDVSGVSEIMLSAEPGADYDLSDHVNWCEASFLKR